MSFWFWVRDKHTRKRWLYEVSGLGFYLSVLVPILVIIAHWILTLFGVLPSQHQD
jgi:hypothetical protein